MVSPASPSPPACLPADRLPHGAATMTTRLLVCSAFLLSVGAVQAAPLTLVQDGQARAVLVVPARLIDDAAKNPEVDGSWHSLKPEDMRRRLRESVKDFVAILERM